MKVFLLVLILSSTNIFSQNDLKKMSISGTGLTMPEKTVPKPNQFTPNSKFPSLSNTNNAFSNPKSTFEISNKKQINISNQNIFVNPNQDVLDKLNNKNAPVSEDFKLIRGNQDFGSFSSKSNLVSVKCRDFGEVDDDEVRIYLNGRLIESRIILDSYFKDFDILLDKGFNKIEIEAINQGTSGPNTAEFKIYDDKGKLYVQNQWSLATGFKAVIVFTNE